MPRTAITIPEHKGENGEMVAERVFDVPSDLRSAFTFARELGACVVNKDPGFVAYFPGLPPLKVNGGHRRKDTPMIFTSFLIAAISQKYLTALRTGPGKTGAAMHEATEETKRALSVADAERRARNEREHQERNLIAQRNRQREVARVAREAQQRAEHARLERARRIAANVAAAEALDPSVLPPAVLQRLRSRVEGALAGYGAQMVAS